MLRRTAIAGFMALTALVSRGPAFAFEVPQISHAGTLKECSACHMVFPPQMLPARSWEGLMNDLSNHFGEDATLDDAVKTDITAYLTANAADSAQNQAAGRRLLRGIKASDVPLRITETPWWKRAHGEVSQAAYAKPNVKSAANCAACHVGAEKGVFREPGD